MKEINILIVEDEPIIAADLRRSIQKMGYSVAGTVESGQEAIEKVRAGQPDLLLMDIQLEGDLDGIETVKIIQRDYSVPVIFLTSNTDSVTFNRAKPTAPYAFMSKPFRQADLKHSIELALTGSNRDNAQNQSNEIQLSPQRDCIFVKDKGWMTKIKLRDILWIESEGSYCRINTEEKEYLVTGSLQKFAERIAVPFLVRVHRSSVINVKAVEAWKEGALRIREKEIAVSKTYRDEVKKLLLGV